MVIRNFYVVGVAPGPRKADPPLIVDTNAVLSLAVPTQPLQPITRNGAENSKIVRRVKHVELPKSRSFDSAKLPAGLAMKEPLSFIAPEGFDHNRSV
jgi:hypothetical protein